MGYKGDKSRVSDHRRYWDSPLWENLTNASQKTGNFLQTDEYRGVASLESDRTTQRRACEWIVTGYANVSLARIRSECQPVPAVRHIGLSGWVAKDVDVQADVDELFDSCPDCGGKIVVNVDRVGEFVNSDDD